MKPLRWRSVSGGIVAVVAIAALVLLVLAYARTGVVRGDKFRLYVAVPDASNVLEGTDVWLNGQRVGTVTAIRFGPPTSAPDLRVVIETEILRSMRGQIRLDSRASLRSGGTVIGAPVVFIESGTPRAREVVAGDTLRGRGRSDLEVAASRVTESIEDLPAIVADAKRVYSLASSARGRASAILGRDYGAGSIPQQTRGLLTRLSGGSGSAGRFMDVDPLRSRIAGSMARVDTLRTLLASRANELGSFRRDSSLATAVRELRSEVGRLRELSMSRTGTIGRVRSDSALRRGLDSAFAELGALFADIRKNPLRYSRVF